MKKEATLRARVTPEMAELVCNEARKLGLLHITDYIRLAIFEKIARDNKTTVDLVIRRGL